MVSFCFLFRFVCFVLNVFFLQVKCAQPVNVTVFFETRCGTSIYFFQRQLAPTYNQLNNIINLDLYAYGSATSKPRVNGNGYTFQCQHGPTECLGNKLVACAKHSISDHESFLSFAFCLMNSRPSIAAAKKCANEGGVPSEPITNCTTSIQGEILLHNEGVIQSQLDKLPNSIPWILINGVFNKENLQLAQWNLKKLVCSVYEGECPN